MIAFEPSVGKGRTGDIAAETFGLLALYRRYTSMNMLLFIFPSSPLSSTRVIAMAGETAAGEGRRRVS